MQRHKIALFGAGNVGGTAAFLCAVRELGDIVLIDTAEREGVAIGKALDIQQSLSLFSSDVSMSGSSDIKNIKDADVVVVLAGFPRKPGMTREDLFNANYQIIETISRGIVTYAPGAIVIMVTNPLDAMTYSMLKLTGFAKNRVIGMAGVLDSIRFQSYLASNLQCSIKDLKALVLGSHGDDMLPVASCTSVNGIPITQIADPTTLSSVSQLTKEAGGEFVKLMGTSAYYAAGASVCSLIECIVKDQQRILPCSVLLEGEFGIHDSCIGVPVILGKNGVEKVVEIDLTKGELEMLQKSALIVQKKK
jgi:malate dehydrogenase